MAYERDPVSVLWDQGAATLLRRAYAAHGAWAGTALAPPQAGHGAYFGAQHITLTDPDTYTSRGRTFRITRWERGFARSLWFLHRWHYRGTTGLDLDQRRMSACRSPVLLIEFGRMTATGRAVRVRAVRGGKAAFRAVEQLPEAARYTTGTPGKIDSTEPGQAWRDPRERDW